MAHTSITGETCTIKPDAITGQSSTVDRGEIIISLWCLVSLLAGKGLVSTIDDGVINHLATRRRQSGAELLMCVDLNTVVLTVKFTPCFLDFMPHLLSCRSYFQCIRKTFLAILQYVNVLYIFCGAIYGSLSSRDSRTRGNLPIKWVFLSLHKWKDNIGIHY